MNDFKDISLSNTCAESGLEAATVRRFATVRAKVPNGEAYGCTADETGGKADTVDVSEGSWVEITFRKFNVVSGMPRVMVKCADVGRRSSVSCGIVFFFGERMLV
ncbi:hypothetical protein [Roseobacter sp.]|uniref:hypothetical protein n=1 Tax=Roseobacter sp. TaxID=1907202 RepID=UPI00385B1A3E